MNAISAESWAQVIAALVAAAGLIFAILKAGATAVRSSANVASSVEELTKTVQRIDTRVESYISGENTRDDSMETWRRTVDSRMTGVESRLLGIESTLATLVSSSVRGRRGA